MPDTETTAAAISALLDAIESRDLRAISSALAPGVRWQNVPHPPIVGRDAVVAMLGDIVTWSDEVRWEIISATYERDVGRLERIDRFRIGGRWYDVACGGAFTVDDSGRVAGVRDDVELAAWRARVDPALDSMRSRASLDVVARHLAAVGDGGTASMSADYARDAVLVRGADVHEGWCSIADYFDTVPERLGQRTVEFTDVAAVARDTVVVRWRISDPTDDTAAATTGRDTFEVQSGRIIRQTVELDDVDF